MILSGNIEYSLIGKSVTYLIVYAVGGIAMAEILFRCHAFEKFADGSVGGTGTIISATNSSDSLHDVSADELLDPAYWRSNDQLLKKVCRDDPLRGLKLIKSIFPGTIMRHQILELYENGIRTYGEGFIDKAVLSRTDITAASELTMIEVLDMEWKALAMIDPASAVQSALKLFGSGDARRLFNVVMETWIENEPEKALEFATSRSEDPRFFQYAILAEAKVDWSQMVRSISEIESAQVQRIGLEALARSDDTYSSPNRIRETVEMVNRISPSAWQTATKMQIVERAFSDYPDTVADIGSKEPSGAVRDTIESKLAEMPDRRTE